MVWKIVRWTSGVLLLLIVGLFVTVQLRWRRTFDAPLPDIHASTDSAVIATGRYLAFGPAHCAYCHTTVETGPALDRGEQPPLSGGFVFNIPPGTFRTPNLTPDQETGIGGMSDGQVARMLRYGVRRDGRAAIPFMNYHLLSDADIRALISFLRSQPAVSHRVPQHDVNLMGKAVMAFVIKPIGPSSTPPAESPPAGTSVERGAYLVTAVAECADCHTERSMVDGHFTGARLAGGSPFEADGNPDLLVVPPNLTPEPKTGRIASWTEEQFVARFRKGRLIPGSPMPWNAFARMTDDDLRAIYRYLRTVTPVEHDPGPSLRPRK
ncbi:MAG TPA: c-type cytochrome [Gemmatimonadales bacterium]|nr:c-type cytochrome [Gemmatimonadales bacterium]